MAKKRISLFHEGNAELSDLLGGKGANLAEMTNIGKIIKCKYSNNVMTIPPIFYVQNRS